MIENEFEAERLLVNSVHRLYQEKCHFFKAEDMQNPGIWDLFYCIDKKEGWAELKYTKNKKKIKLRPTQYRWGRQAIDAGRRTFLILCDESEAPGSLIFIPGDYIRHRKIEKYEEWMAAWRNTIGFSVPIPALEANIQRVVSFLRGEV
jgi:hypothetical protein